MNITGKDILIDLGLGIKEPHRFMDNVHYVCGHDIKDGDISKKSEKNYLLNCFCGNKYSFKEHGK